MGMIRGMIRGYDSWVWFADLDLVLPCILRVWLFTHTYPENVSTVGNYTIRGALWSWHAVDAVRAAVRVVCALWSGHRGAVGMPLQGAGAGCCLLSEWCVQFGAMLVALRVLLQVLPEGDDWRCCCQSGVCCKRASLLVLLQGVMLQGAARRVRTVPNSCCKGASEGCCCTLQGAVVGFFSEAAGGVV